MSYHRVRSSISYIIGLIAAVLIAMFKFNDPDPLIFGIYSFSGFIVFSWITWIAIGVLLKSVEHNKSLKPESSLVDITVDDESPLQEEAKTEESQELHPLVDSLGQDGKIDWRKLESNPEDDLSSNEFIPFDLFKKAENE